MRLAVFFPLSISWFCAAQPAAGPDWPMYSRDYQSTSYSPLTAITPANVAGLKQLCAYEVPETVTFESSLVVVAGVMYFTTDRRGGWHAEPDL